MDLPVEENFKQVIIRCISFMKHQITGSDDIHTSIHESRKSCKRIRAVLKMIRDEMGYSNYYRENSFYRHLAGRMSGSRDDYVLLQCIENLARKRPEAFNEDALRPIKKLLSHRIKEATDQFNSQWGGFDHVIKDLEEAEKRILHCCSLRNDFAAMERGLRRIYRRGYRYNRSGQRGESMEEFHEYRKNTKYLLHQIELISPVYPKVMNAYAASLRKHAEQLGDTRDLDRLNLFLEQIPEGTLHPAPMEDLQELIRVRKRKRLKKIFRRSSLLYAEKPKRFIQRLEAYWEETHQKN